MLIKRLIVSQQFPQFALTVLKDKIYPFGVFSITGGAVKAWFIIWYKSLSSESKSLIFSSQSIKICHEPFLALPQVYFISWMWLLRFNFFTCAHWSYSINPIKVHRGTLLSVTISVVIDPGCVELRIPNLALFFYSSYILRNLSGDLKTANGKLFRAAAQMWHN